MPLVILCGLPSSGKSIMAKTLNDHFSSSRNCVLITDEDAPSGFMRNEIYADASKEKELRSSLKSKVERYLSKDKIVILDAANYIKGFRYELYCVSKGCKTTYCVIHCDLLPSDCWAFNETKPPPIQYSKTIFDALVARFETPDSRNRWDSPLFIKHKDENLPLKDIEDALFQRKPPPPNQSTQNQPLAATNFLYDLDKITQDVVKAILNAQKISGSGVPIEVPKSDKKIQLTRLVTAGELNRIRRQFISYTKTHVVSNNNEIPNMFVNYVNKSV